MSEVILETKWDEVLEGLEAEGLPKEKAREILPKAVTFLFEVTRRGKEQYLAGTTLKTRRETLDRLIQIAQKYPGVRGLLSKLYLGEEKKAGKLTNGQILQLCEETTLIGLTRELQYLGKESRKWRVVGQEKEFEIPFVVRNAAVHVFDRNQRCARHFFPTDWRNTAEIELTSYLADEVKRNDAPYRAAKDARKAATTGTAKPIVDPELMKMQLTTPPPPGKPKKYVRRATQGSKDEDGEKPTVKPPKGGRGAAERQSIEQGLNEAETV